MSGDDLPAYDDLAAQEGPNSRRVYLRRNDQWEGKSVFQMLELDHTGSVVLMLVGPESDSPLVKDPEYQRTIQMYILMSLVSLVKWAVANKGAHPLNLGTFTVQNMPTKKNHPMSSIVARGLKSLVPTATSSSSGASQSSSSYQPLLTPQSGSSSQRPLLAAPVRPPPRTNSDESSWEMVDDLPLRWARDFVPLALAESRLVNASVLSFALWTRDEGPSLVELYEHANGAEHDENRESERQKSKALEPSSKAQAYTSHSLLGMVRLGSSGAFRVRVTAFKPSSAAQI
ncbi:hypothetical protein DFH08DRAFT_804852 [Mycena albidolilacea]|uniref:Uncharacterized protein n=1 Tax=Mycena albidolilacea TaxID=1033008 RepID=A0AAD7AB92_9AGAR|nr:hypothetical protein DFH08DRAFT_804852 [Mycena albidolilacea]